MCGIIGYIGFKPARNIIINGLKRLEYRGYDSAGMVLVNGEIKIYKCKGRVKDLEELVNKF
jgi:glucosamine--fructose-6-phosphate aminotransferase (isomerizing)